MFCDKHIKAFHYFCIINHITLVRKLCVCVQKSTHLRHWKWDEKMQLQDTVTV